MHAQTWWADERSIASNRQTASSLNKLVMETQHIIVAFSSALLNHRLKYVRDHFHQRALEHDLGVISSKPSVVVPPAPRLFLKPFIVLVESLAFADQVSLHSHLVVDQEPDNFRCLALIQI